MLLKCISIVYFITQGSTVAPSYFGQHGQQQYSLQNLTCELYRNFYGVENEKILLKMFNIFLVFALTNIDCGYMLELPIWWF